MCHAGASVAIRLTRRGVPNPPMGSPFIYSHLRALSSIELPGCRSACSDRGNLAAPDSPSGETVATAEDPPGSPLNWPEERPMASWPGLEPSARQWTGLRRKRGLHSRQHGPGTQERLEKQAEYSPEKDVPFWPTSPRLPPGEAFVSAVPPSPPPSPPSSLNIPTRAVAPPSPSPEQCQHYGCKNLHYCNLRPARRVRLAAAYALTVTRQAQKRARKALSCEPPFDIWGVSAAPRRRPEEKHHQLSSLGWEEKGAFGSSRLNRILSTSTGLRVKGSGSPSIARPLEHCVHEPSRGHCRQLSAVGQMR